MTLKHYNKKKITEWESILNEASGNLRRILDSMEAEGMESSNIEATKAIAFLEYIVKWSIRCESKHRENLRDRKITGSVEEARARKKK